MSDVRVAMRVSQGGQLIVAFERPYVGLYDNDHVSAPFQLIAAFERERPSPSAQLPPWLQRLLQ